MTQNVTMPDGTLVAFPDAMSKDQIRNLILSKFPNAAPPPPVAPVESALRGAADGATLGWGDEGAAALAINPFQGDWGGQYDANLNRVRGEQSAAQTAHPGAFFTGQVLSGAPSVVGAQLVPGLDVGADASWTSMMARGLASGAATGAAYGAGSANGSASDRLQGAGQGALVGGILGAVTPVAGRAIGNVVGRVGAAASVPTQAAIKAQSTAMFAQARNAGIVVAPSALQTAATAAKTAATNLGWRAYQGGDLTGALANLDTVVKSGAPQTLDDVLSLRQEFADLRGSPDAGVAARASAATDQLDSFLANLNPSQVTSGSANAAQVGQIIGQGRQLWGQQKNGEVIGDILNRAKVSARADKPNSYENALMSGFTALAKNKTQMAFFSPDEQAAIIAAAKGGGVPSQLARLVGKFSPFNAGTVTGGMGLGGAVLSGNPNIIGAVAGAEVGRQAGNLGARNAAAYADALTRNAGTPPFNAVNAQRAQLLSNALLGVTARGVVPGLADLQQQKYGSGN